MAWNDAFVSLPPTDGSLIEVELEDGQTFKVRHDPQDGVFGTTKWRIGEAKWLTPWSLIVKWKRA